MTSAFSRIVLPAVLLALTACGGQTEDELFPSGSGAGGQAPGGGGGAGGSSGGAAAGAPGTGGSSGGAAAGAPGTGGVPGMGGMPGVGGQPGVGGAPPAGGAPGAGGMPGTGGAPPGGQGGGMVSGPACQSCIEEKCSTQWAACQGSEQCQQIADCAFSKCIGTMVDGKTCIGQCLAAAGVQGGPGQMEGGPGQLFFDAFQCGRDSCPGACPAKGGGMGGQPPPPN